ncbi:MAG: hypothetical protein IJ446_00775 [Oscillospiraceae bacterium]|nr:hypothetical protein [Oscillospiraceae bacterium]
MSIFDVFSKKRKITIDDLKKEYYKPMYKSQCIFIWKNYVTESGQSEVLQGELLRQLEKLRYEARDNGNFNWDKDFEYFCTNIKDTLCSQSIYSKSDKEKITLIMEYFRECGKNSISFYDEENDEINMDEQVCFEKLAYTEDDLYDIIADYIAIFHIKNKEQPVPCKINPDIRR